MIFFSKVLMHNSFNHMTLIIISTGDYPDQHAAAIRHSTLAQGMAENGHKVYFFILSPQQWKSNTITYKGVTYRTLNNHHEDNKILKRFNSYKALIKLKKNIEEIKNTEGIDGIIVFTVKNKIIKTVLEIGKKELIKVFHERTELPYVFGARKSLMKFIRYKYYMNFLIPRFHGLFVISDKLNKFFQSYNKSIEKIPTVVDCDFFANPSPSPYDFPYIGYCGTMSGNKDGIPILIKAFAKLHIDFPEYKLLLIGKDTESKIKDTVNTIEQLQIKDSVFFTGFVERQEMPNLLGNAKLLVVSKPNNEQNSGNFPIKIGEYLSTGVPVVVTRVGEIPNFISDGENGFIAEPDSVNSFYIKMKEALSDYKRAQVIGKAGKETAEKSFDYKIHSEKMTRFITNIKNIQNNGK